MQNIFNQVCICFLRYSNNPQFADRQDLAKSADSDQAAPLMLLLCSLIRLLEKISMERPLLLNYRAITANIYEPRHEKTNILVSNLVRHKPGCTATEDG